MALALTSKRDDDCGAADAGDDQAVAIFDNDEDTDVDCLPRVSATLVVAPMSMIGQWRREILTYTAGAASVRVHYGTERIRSMHELGGVDFVLTSYGTLASEYDVLLKSQAAASAALAPASSSVVSGGSRRPGAHTLAALMEQQRSAPGPVPVLYGVRWQRVGLDEAHVIRNRATKSARACFDIAASHRWALTGTPLQVGSPCVRDARLSMMLVPFPDPLRCRIRCRICTLCFAS